MGLGSEIRTLLSEIASKIKWKLGQMVGKFGGQGQKGTGMGIPYQTFLVLVPPNPLFYDLKLIEKQVVKT